MPTPLGLFRRRRQHISGVCRAGRGRAVSLGQPRRFQTCGHGLAFPLARSGDAASVANQLISGWKDWFQRGPVDRRLLVEDRLTDRARVGCAGAGYLTLQCRQATRCQPLVVWFFVVVSMSAREGRRGAQARPARTGCRGSSRNSLAEGRALAAFFVNCDSRAGSAGVSRPHETSSWQALSMVGASARFWVQPGRTLAADGRHAKPGLARPGFIGRVLVVRGHAVVVGSTTLSASRGMWIRPEIPP